MYKASSFQVLDYSAIEPCCESLGVNTTIVEVEKELVTSFSTPPTWGRIFNFSSVDIV
jgi:hypothetical protein